MRGVLEVVDGVRDDLAGDKEPALEDLLVLHALALADEDLQMRRLRRLHGLAEIARIDRHVAPAEKMHALVRDRLRDDLLDDPEAFPIARHEEVADAVFAGLREGDAEGRALLDEEVVRDLHENAATVAHLRVGADGAAMVEVLQDLEALGDDRVRLAVLHVGDEADAAGILLVGGIVEALRRRQRRVARRMAGRRGGRLASSRQIAHPALAQRLAARRRCMFRAAGPVEPFRTGRTRFVA